MASLNYNFNSITTNWFNKHTVPAGTESIFSAACSESEYGWVWSLNDEYLIMLTSIWAFSLDLLFTVHKKIEL